MPLILHIDTATENAIVSISKNGNVLHSLFNNKQKDHASFLQPAVKEVLQLSGIQMLDLKAVSITAGPGSYTGIRVGMASAKGLCYALKIPLIILNTLEVMALSAIEENSIPELYLYCPMIDARRMEVFTALFDHELHEILPACALILEPNYFDEISNTNKIIFSGSGAKKFINLSGRGDLLFSNAINSAAALATLSFSKFQQQTFSDLIYAEPLYIKSFFTNFPL